MPLNVIIIIITATWVCRFPFCRFGVDTGVTIAQLVVCWAINGNLEKSPSFKYCNQTFFFTRMLINNASLQKEVSHHVWEKGEGGVGSTNLEMIYVHEKKSRQNLLKLLSI